MTTIERDMGKSKELSSIMISLTKTVFSCLPEVTNMKSERWTRTSETEQALAVGTKVDKMTNPAAKMDTMLDKREYAWWQKTVNFKTNKKQKFYSKIICFSITLSITIQSIDSSSFFSLLMEYKTIWNGNGPWKVCPSPSIKPLCWIFYDISMV